MTKIKFIVLQHFSMPSRGAERAAATMDGKESRRRSHFVEEIQLVKQLGCGTCKLPGNCEFLTEVILSLLGCACCLLDLFALCIVLRLSLLVLG